jgi:YfiH family protein
MHGVVTRKGGVSPSPWDSLNVGLTVGDESKRVIENRERIFKTFELDNRRIFDVWQVHSDKVICVNSTSYNHSKIEKADAMVTNSKGLGLFMRFADCVPIFLFDPVKKVIGITHAGWKGTVAGIAQKTVKNMECGYGSKPGDIIAAIGPSICTEHYEVGPEVVKEVEETFGSDANTFLFETAGRIGEKKLFNLKSANKNCLHSVGVKQIEVSQICTACNLSDWYSHRGENGKTGRFGAIIAMKG